MISIDLNEFIPSVNSLQIKKEHTIESLFALYSKCGTRCKYKYV